MKIPFFFFLLICGTISFRSQTLSIGTGSPMSEIKNSEIIPFYVNSYNNFYFMTWENDFLPSHHIYTWQGTSTSNNDEIKLPGKEKNNGEFKNIIGTKEKMYLFRSQFSKEQKKNILYAHPLFPTLEVKEEGTEINSSPATKANLAGEFGINRSASGNFIVSFGEYPKEKEVNEKFSIAVTDAAMNVKWNKEFQFPYPSKKIPYNDVFISDKGGVFTIKRVDDVNFSVFIPDAEKGNLIEVKLEPGGAKKINNYNISFNAAGECVVAGFYTEDAVENKEKEVSFTGSYYFRIGTDGKIIAKNTNAFPAPLKHLEIRCVFAMDDKKTLLVGEDLKKEKLGMSAGYEAADKTMNTCKNVYLYLLDENGKMIWTNVIEKEATTYNDGAIYSMCNVQLAGEKIIVLINDEKKKYHSKDERVPVLFVINKDGTKEKPVAMPISNKGIAQNLQLMSCAATKISEKEFMFMGSTDEAFYSVTLKLP
ncbi:MAG: hypothetical protein IAF38_21495 [Bacteroidia bacterium]|nr:hypothetical protein [Bacteroidia bacterium]